MNRQFLAAVVTATLFVFPEAAFGQKGTSHGSTHESSVTKGSASSTPVHVKSYTKKDGTTVEAHDRKAPAPRADSGPMTAPRAESGPMTGAAGSSPIRVYIDPVSGRKTLTNEPLPTAPPLSSTTIAATTATTTGITSSPRTKKTATTTSSHTVVSHETTSAGIPRLANGKIARSQAARHAFERQTGYPSGRPGYVIDHIKPLACGGADATSNMQWQTIEAAKAKDKVERLSCR